jgi:4-hydroxyphenylacetate 3-monooxygenase/4-hydroxybutyryl-CoA dehydratase/vinylacetyl-CoA-Delta-isomerase
MAIKSSQDYMQRIKRLKPNVYVGGKTMTRDAPLLTPAINVARLTFDAAFMSEYRPLVVTQSHLNGEEITRFSHVHQSPEDLLKKQQMLRVLVPLAGGCIQRCMSNDVLNALGIVTKEVDEAKGTEYHPRFLKYLDYYQKNDLIAAGAQTDVKGDRSKRPHQQADPDLYLRIVEKRKDGIVVRGAKAHITISAYVDELLVIPTRALTPEEGNWAVAFAIPADTDGIKLMTRVTTPRQRIECKAPYNEVGGWADSMVIFDNVFVPNERVFMCGEWEFGGRLALLFANYHRHSYTGCKPGVTDLIMGTCALTADYSGVGNAPHIRDEITELMVIAELIYASGIAASVKAKRTSSGIWEPASIYSNTGRYLAGKNICREYEAITAIAGGLPATLPFEEEWLNPETKRYLEKYLMRNPEIAADKQHLLARFISDFSCSAVGGVMQYAGVHGGGSPVMELIGIRSQYDLEARKMLVKYLSGIEQYDSETKRELAKRLAGI